MAQKITDIMSVIKILRICRRLVRLLSHIPGTETLIEEITVLMNELKAKMLITEEKEDEYLYAVDFQILQDELLDTVVVDVFENCKSYDRNTVGKPILNTIFPGGTCSNYTRENRLKEPDKVMEIVVRLQALGEDHPLYVNAQRIETAAKASKDAIRSIEAPKAAFEKAKTEEHVARCNMVEQYRLTNLHAQELLGKKKANQVFPKIRNYKKKKGEAQNTNTLGS